ncbi:MAG: ATP-grasp domain-containing protein [Bdellovibrio sp.]|nr:ATP-grasp domain-containing protein [Bdellovibrio sp.]
MNETNVLFLAVSLSFLKIIEKYFESGLLKRKRTFFLIDFFQQQIPSVLPDNCIASFDLLDQTEIDRVATLLREKGNFSAVIALQEMTQYAAADIRKQLGVPGPSKGEMEKFRDKVIMKKALVGSNIRTPRVYSEADLRKSTISFPIISKPKAFCGSIGVSLVKNQAELDLLLQRKKEPLLERYDTDFPEMRVDDLEFEEFIEGDIYHVDGISFGHQLIFSKTSKYINSCLDFINGKPIGNIELDEPNEIEKWQQFASVVIEWMHLPDGAFHLEAFLTPKGERVFLEIAARVPGGLIAHTINEVHGVDFCAAHIQCQLGIVPVIPPHSKNYSGDLIFPMHFIEEGGIPARFVKTVTPISKRELPSLRWIKLPEVAAPAESDFSYEHNLGGFIFESANVKEIERDILHAIDNYKVTTTSTKDNVLFVATTLSFVPKIEKYFKTGLLDRAKTFFLIDFFQKEIPSRLPQNCLAISDLLNQQELESISKSLLEKHGLFKAVITMDELSLYTVSDLRNRLNTPGLRKAEMAKFRDKVIMKQSLAESGIRTPRLYNLGHLKQGGDAKFPLIVKPRAFGGSIGVKLIQTQKELDLQLNRETVPVPEGYDSLYTEMRVDDVEYEEFIEGDTYHVDGIVFGGKLLFCKTFRHINSCLDFIGGKPLGNIAVADSKEIIHWETFAARVIEIMNVPDGAFHLEAFLNPKGERIFLEIATRPPGGMISNTFNEIYGIDLTEAHIQSQLGIMPNLPKEVPAMGGDLLFPLHYIKEGEVPSCFVETVTQMTKDDLPTLKWSKYPVPGDPAENEFAYEHNLGGFIFGSSNILEVERDILHAMDTYKVRISR